MACSSLPSQLPSLSLSLSCVSTLCPLIPCSFFNCLIPSLVLDPRDAVLEYPLQGLWTRLGFPRCCSPRLPLFLAQGTKALMTTNNTSGHARKQPTPTLTTLIRLVVITSDQSKKVLNQNDIPQAAPDRFRSFSRSDGPRLGGTTGYPKHPVTIREQTSLNPLGGM